MNSEALHARFLSIRRRKDYKAAVDFQNEVKALIPGKPVRKKFRYVCGVDISYNKSSDRIFAAASLHSFPDLEIIEQRGITAKTSFPYIPGLLAYREGPAVISLLEKMNTSIDLLIFDGHGLAHPRGAGIASLMGLLLDIPSIGCAKTKLVGEFDYPGMGRGASSKLYHNSRIVGEALRTRDNVKPVFVSTGYKISLKKSVVIILKCCPRYRIPEPIRRAHVLSNKLRRELL